MTHPLGETFYTQTPFRYGDHIAKLSVAPVTIELTALKNASVDLSGKPNGLRQSVIDFFAEHGGVWELRVQLCTNPDTMPVEDASVSWLESESPYVAVARIDLVKLKRRTGALAGLPQKPERSRPDAGEQVVSHGGHLALSAAAGLAYAAAKPDSVPPVVAGTAFGAAFYGLAYGVLGPALGVTPRLSRDTIDSVVQHGLFHVLFGVTTAVATERIARRI